MHKPWGDMGWSLLDQLLGNGNYYTIMQVLMKELSDKGDRKTDMSCRLTKYAL